MSPKTELNLFKKKTKFQIWSIQELNKGFELILAKFVTRLGLKPKWDSKLHEHQHGFNLLLERYNTVFQVEMLVSDYEVRRRTTCKGTTVWICSGNQALEKS